MKAKILFLDIETAPSLGYVWGKWQQDVIEFKSDGYILSFAYKWAHERTTHVLSLAEMKGYKPGKNDDSELVKLLWGLVDEADIIIAHNGDNFDLKTANYRFVVNQLPPPSPYVTIDTLKLARKYFKFTDNRLDELGRVLGLGRKVAHTGKSLWFGCMDGDETSWRLMKKYNKQDVVLLENVYQRIHAYHTNHPNPNVISGKLDACPHCQSSKIQKRGFSITKLSRKPRYHCQDCGSWSTGQPEKILEIR